MSFEQAFHEVEKQLEIASILSEQKESIRPFFQKANRFISLPKGYGKSLIFECLHVD